MFEEAEKFAITFELDLEASISQVALLATVPFCFAFIFEIRVFIVLHFVMSSLNCLQEHVQYIWCVVYPTFLPSSHHLVYTQHWHPFFEIVCLLELL